MTNLVIAILITNQVIAVSFDAEPFMHYRLMRRATPSVNTNWLGADSYEFQPYSQPVVLVDTYWTSDAWYEVVGLAVH